MAQAVKPKPEHLATMRAIQTIRDTIRNLEGQVAALAATLPQTKPSRSKKSDRWIIDPLTNKKRYY